MGLYHFIIFELRTSTNINISSHQPLQTLVLCIKYKFNSNILYIWMFKINIDK